MSAKRERYTPNDVGPSPHEWAAPRLSEVSTLITNGFVGTATPYYTDDSGIPYLYGTNVRANRVDTDGIRYVTPEFHSSQSKTELRTGDLLTVQSGHIGETAVVTGDIDGANCHALIVTRLKQDKVYPQFLSYYMNSEIGRARMKGLEVGSTILHINTKDLKKFRVLLPSISEQKKIAQILSTWDKAITNTEQLLANSQRQKKALMQQLLTGKKRLLDKNAVRFSGEWKFQSLSQIAKRVQRKSDGKDHPILTISSLSGFVRQDERYSRYMAGESVKSYILLKKGEFAYNKGNSKTYQYGCIFDLDAYEVGLVPHVYVCFKLNQGLSHRYFKYLFEADYLKPQLGALVNTGVRNNGLLNIKPSEFMETKVPVPILDEQERIADALQYSTDAIKGLEKNLSALRQEKSALMQQLLTGRRRVKCALEAAL